MKKYMRGIKELQNYGKKVRAGVARGGSNWAGGAFARGGRGHFRGEPRRRGGRGRWTGAGVGVTRERGADAFGVNPGGVWRLRGGGV